MKHILDQFIGIFPNAVNDQICSEFVKYFNAISEQGLTMCAMEDQSRTRMQRKDEVVHIPAINKRCFPINLCQSLWKNIGECYNIYHNEYSVEDKLTSHDFKMHRVLPTGGYHVWHHEQSFFMPDVVLAWHVTIEAPKRGGETEFLNQSIRVEPKVGQLAIWPGAFTHKHRGNPPLEGRKSYITGRFDLAIPPDQRNWM